MKPSEIRKRKAHGTTPYATRSLVFCKGRTPFLELEVDLLCPTHCRSIYLSAALSVSSVPVVRASSRIPALFEFVAKLGRERVRWDKRLLSRKAAGCERRQCRERRSGQAESASADDTSFFATVSSPAGRAMAPSAINLQRYPARSCIYTATFKHPPETLF